MRWRVMAAVVGVGVLAGCQTWPSPRATAGNTGFNASESQLSLNGVASLHDLYTAPAGLSDGGWTTPVESGGTVFVASHGELMAFDENGAEGCTGSPLTCTPEWTASLNGGEVADSAVVDNGKVFVSVLSSTTVSPGELFAFDATGSTGCSGVPKQCGPLWTAPAGGFSSPAVSSGVVFVPTIGNVLAAFDENGTQNCGGSPVVCSPLWTSSPLSLSRISEPAVSNGTVFVTGVDLTLSAFDAAGNGPCGGTPKVCSPTWTATFGTGTEDLVAAPVVSDGRVFVYDAGQYSGTLPSLAAVDATGLNGCSGSPKICAPLWSTQVPGTGESDSQLAVAYGSVFVVTRTGTVPGPPFVDQVLAYDATGSGCSGTPQTCSPQWATAPLSAAGVYPVIADGVLYERTLPGSVGAFDANGSTNCSGTPRVCRPVSTITTATPHDVRELSVSNGKLFIGAQDPAPLGSFTYPGYLIAFA